MGKSWENHGKSWENHEKTVGNHWNIYEHIGLGKSWEIGATLSSFGYLVVGNIQKETFFFGLKLDFPVTSSFRNSSEDYSHSANICVFLSLFGDRYYIFINIPIWWGLKIRYASK
jgi:hypothetical protein